MRPVLLDLFCGAGGAAEGYYRAGFDIVGVDINPQPHYPFDFEQGDALEILQRGWDTVYGGKWDAIHASPPCQWQTAYARRPGHVADSPNLISQVRTELRRRCVPYGVPYVIESPESKAARGVMIAPVRLCGSAFNLDVQRHRLFESNIALRSLPCCHNIWWPRFKPATNRTNLRSTVEVGVWRIPLEDQQHAMGIDWMTRAELSQAIPPDYTEFIGRQLMAHVKQRAA